MVAITSLLRWGSAAAAATTPQPTSTNVALSNGSTINATVISVNNTVLLNNASALPSSVDEPTIVRMDSTLATNVSDPIFVSLENNSSSCDQCPHCTGHDKALHSSAIAQPRTPYLYTGRNVSHTDAHAMRVPCLGNASAMHRLCEPVVGGVQCMCMASV